MKPDFICIGPEKTATTWLFSMLEGHPQVWLPPYKELRFLTEGNLVPEHSLKNLFFSPHWHCRELRRILIRNTVKMLLLKKTEGYGPFETYAWVLRYMFGSHTFAWYDSLFRAGEGLLCGDITPNYYHIPEARICELHQHNPETKILLFVRNPIDRAWSHATMNYCQHSGRDFDTVTDDEWMSMLNELHDLWVPYDEVIRRWQKYFPNMAVCFFDQLKTDPEQFFAGISDFLGIESELNRKTAAKVVGKGVGKPIPEKIKEHLQAQYGDEIRALVGNNISPYPAQWLSLM
ncbi:MAG: sulfotransferase [Mariprofundaceae bacterium]